MKYKAWSVIKHLLIGLLLPVVLWVNAFIIPEPYSRPLIKIAVLPQKLMPFLENIEMMREITVLIFGKMTPKYATIGIIFLIIFWLIIGVILSVVIRTILKKKSLR